VKLIKNELMSLSWPGHFPTDLYGCHVRIWEGEDRTIVLVGNLNDRYLGSSWNDTIIDEVAWRHFPDGRGFELFVYEPRDIVRRDRPRERPFRRVTFEVNEEQRQAITFIARILGVGFRGRQHPLEECLRRGPHAFVQQDTYEPQMTLAEFEEYLCSPVDVFPVELYSAEHVRRYIENGYRPTTIMWDPYGVLSDLAAVRCLDEAIQAAEVFWRENTAEQRGGHETIKLLRFGAYMLAWDSRYRQATYELEEAGGWRKAPTSPDEMLTNPEKVALAELHAMAERRAREARETNQNASLRKQYPSLSTQDWELLDHYGSEDSEFSVSWEKHRNNLLALRALLQDQEAHGPARNPWVTPKVEEILRDAEARLTRWVRMADEHFAAHDHPQWVTSVLLEVRGNFDRDYLATVDWRSLDPGDEKRFTVLAQQCTGYDDFRSEPLEQLTGYDPFGRLIIHSSSAEFFVVEWPLIVPQPPYPDEARIVGCGAKQGGERPVYVLMPDGSMDLLPAYPSQSSQAPSFQWGYGGGGPNELELAIKGACCKDYRDLDDPWDEAFRPFQGWIDFQIRNADRDHLDLKVGEIRRWFHGQIRPEELRAYEDA